ncbi:MAG: helix-turn-helix domain-containing protein [bacterium]|nr:helix-turn-helix domain-containing protein [bacterium]
MARVALTAEQRRKYKLRDFKGWVVKQMKLNGKRQADVAEALGLSTGRVSQMLKIPDPVKDKGKHVTEDPFTYGQVLILCDLFGVSGEERERLLTL